MSQSALSVGSICQIRVVQPSVQYPLSSNSIRLSSNKSQRFDLRDGHVRPSAKPPSPMFNTGHGKVMPWALWTGDRDRELNPRARDIVAGKLTLGAEGGD